MEINKKMINKLKDLRATGAEEGFTLIELMIVVVIIGILAAIAIPIFANQQKSAIVAGLKSDVKNTNTNIATALVKSPTAAVVAGNASSTNGTGRIGPVGVTNATAVSTFSILASDAETIISVGGSWNNYYIYGSNSAVSSGSGFNSLVGNGSATLAANNESELKASISPGSPWVSVLYSSKLGKTVTVGD